MASPKHFWQRTPRGVRQLLVAIAGLACITAGIAMLVLPGPGWAAIFLGLAILATEFEQAERIRDWLIKRFKRFIDKAKKAAKR